MDSAIVLYLFVASAFGIFNPNIGFYFIATLSSVVLFSNWMSS